ncbi:MAG: 4-hydroxythreonine-4-phosphate dehydrogenase PdxA [Gammaproteobacteria bacterium]|nr:4-hydroxythreonine-4-phosphate dehydrogenase PdxA [Gammaproteobacteria bacterium]
MYNELSPLILTTGEPAGIGPDLCIQLSEYLVGQPVVLCGDINMLRARADLHQKNVRFHYEGDTPSTLFSLPVRHVSLGVEVVCGQLATANSRYVIETLDIAAKGALSGTYSGIITAPIHKGVICDAGGEFTTFSGHTEFFAQRTGAELPVMVLGNENLKVGLVTTHLPLHAVSAAVTAKRLTQIIEIIHRDMQRYFTNGIPPKIGVCGLNPHAGESGHMGMEEIEVITPTLNALRNSGILVSEALPADTLFVPHNANQYDIIVAMYHDQGLPVIKSQGFGDCVNMTFGLPIVRTSVDHGTALELAGTANANPNSLRCATEYAKKMAQL